MTRENMFSATDLEPWVTAAMEKDLKQVATGGALLRAGHGICEKPQGAAQKNEIPHRFFQDQAQIMPAGLLLTREGGNSCGRKYKE